MLRRMLVIVLIALTASACSSSRQVAKTESTELRINGSTEERINGSTEIRINGSTEVAVRDTIVETTTIVVRENEAGDTLRLERVTDRTRAVSRDNIAAYRTKTVIKTDTVFVERRDSVAESRKYGSTDARSSPFVASLKWVFWIILALIGLGIVLKIRT